MGAASSSPVNCASGDDGASVVVGGGGGVVVVGGGAIVVVVVGGAVVVDEVGERDRRLVPAPLHAVMANTRTHTGAMRRAR